MERLKLRFLAISLGVLLLTLFTQESIAYYSTIGKATNVVTSGNVKLKIHERTDQGTEFPSEGVYIMPGDVVSKEVSVENICKHPFYLRVKVVSGVNSKELSAEDCFKLNIDEANWTYMDGWYYYNGVVEPGEMTPNVFTKVEIVGDKVDTSYLGKTLTLTVAAHAVQTENNIADFAWEAQGWPAEVEEM